MSRVSKLKSGAVKSRSQTPLSVAKAAPPPSAPSVSLDGRTTEYSSTDDKCPICKTDRYLNPKLRLLVSKCYHKLCESCIDRIFTLGPEPCPVCGTELRKTGFMAQTFEDLKVEKEVAIRKRITRCFNKREHDFADLLAYNNYLEEVEEITFNLINSVDVAATEARIKAYQRANAALIASNARLDSTESSQQRALEAKEKENRLANRKMMEQLENEEASTREKEEADIIAALEGATDEREVKMLLKKAKMEKKKKALEVPEEWARLMGPSSALPEETALDLQNKEDQEMRDVLIDYKLYYDYSDLFEIPAANAGYPLDAWTDFGPTQEDQRYKQSVMAAGYKVEDVWSRALRSGLQGLWTAPSGYVPSTGATEVEMGTS